MNTTQHEKEQFMKSTRFATTCTIAKTFAIAAVTALALGIAPAANAQDKACSAATLQGTFVYTSTGFIVAAPIPSIVGPSAEVGTQYFDGKGGVTFTFNASQNGNIFPATGSATETGTYTVNDNCTGTFTEANPGFTAHFSFVIYDNGNGFQAICQDTGVVDTVIARRQYPILDRSYFRN
jgi:hypothetical protein